MDACTNVARCAWAENEFGVHWTLARFFRFCSKSKDILNWLLSFHFSNTFTFVYFLFIWGNQVSGISAFACFVPPLTINDYSSDILGFLQHHLSLDCCLQWRLCRRGWLKPGLILHSLWVSLLAIILKVRQSCLILILNHLEKVKKASLLKKVPFDIMDQ